MPKTQEETIKARENWNYALGMAKLSGGEPSDEFLALVENHINSEITSDDIRKALNEKYSKVG